MRPMTTRRRSSPIPACSAWPAVRRNRRIAPPIISVLLLALAACGKPRPPAAAVRPLPGAGPFREVLACDPIIQASVVDLISLLRKDFGQVSADLFKVPASYSWSAIDAHYARELPRGWRSLSYPVEHAHYRLGVWSNTESPPRYFAVALLHENACPENLPYKILVLAIPGNEASWHMD